MTPLAEFHDHGYACIPAGQRERKRDAMIAVPSHAISIRQPFAELILRGEKTEEHRDWPLPSQWIGVWLALHAPGKVGLDGHPVYMGLWHRLGDPPTRAVVGLVRCGRSREAALDLMQFVWPLTGRLRLPTPVPCKGALGFWRLPDDVRVEIARQLAAMETDEREG